MDSARCRYRMRRGDGDCCCVRPTWRDERCVWHADVPGKSGAALSAACDGSATGRLDDAVLRGATLDDRVSFAGAGLAGADLADTNLQEVDFRDATLDDADLSEVDARGADLRGASLQDARGPNAEFADATFAGASVTHADFEHASFQRVDLIDVTVRDSDLSDATFTDACLKHADLVNVDCHETDFSRASLRNALAVQCDFTGAVFAEASLVDALVEWSTMERAVLFSADLQDARFEVSRLREADLSSADLRRTALEKTTCDRANLAGADLRGADLYSSTLAAAHVSTETQFGDTCTYDDPEAFGTDADYGRVERLRRAAWTYRTIERVAEYNSLPEVARENYLRRKDAWKRRYRAAGEYVAWGREAVADVLMRYGESPYRVVSVALALIVFCAFLYPIWGMRAGLAGRVVTYGSTPLRDVPVLLARSVYFSVVTFTGLGYSSMDAIGVGRAVATVETLAGGFLIALFVFVLGRRTTW